MRKKRLTVTAQTAVEVLFGPVFVFITFYKPPVPCKTMKEKKPKGRRTYLKPK
jgi:hypothetical protein